MLEVPYVRPRFTEALKLEMARKAASEEELLRLQDEELVPQTPSCNPSAAGEGVHQGIC